MSVMWSPEEALRTAHPVVDVAVEAVDRRLRAQVWASMIALNVVAWGVGLWLVATAIF